MPTRQRGPSRRTVYCSVSCGREAGRTGTGVCGGGVCGVCRHEARDERVRARGGDGARGERARRRARLRRPLPALARRRDVGGIQSLELALVEIRGVEELERLLAPRLLLRRDPGGARRPRRGHRRHLGARLGARSGPKLLLTLSSRQALLSSGSRARARRARARGARGVIRCLRPAWARSSSPSWRCRASSRMRPTARSRRPPTTIRRRTSPSRRRSRRTRRPATRARAPPRRGTAAGGSSAAARAARPRRAGARGSPGLRRRLRRRRRSARGLPKRPAVGRAIDRRGVAGRVASRRVGGLLLRVGAVELEQRGGPESRRRRRRRR